MRVAVFVLALIGGILDILFLVLGLGVVGAVASVSGGFDSGTGEIGIRLGVAFALAIATIVSGSLVLTRRDPKKNGAALLVVSIAGIVFAGGFFLIGGILGLVAGVLALFVKREAAPLAA